MSANEFFTQAGYDALTAEIKDLKGVQRPAVIEEIDIARSHGDLKENAEYHAAKEKQSFIDSRIAELGSILAQAKIIDPKTLDHSKVAFGSTVSLLDLDTERQMTYELVDMMQSNPEENRLYYKTPLAKQVIGKSKGEEIEVALPAGFKEYKIIDITFK